MSDAASTSQGPCAESVFACRKKYGNIWKAQRDGFSKEAEELRRPRVTHRAVSPSASLITQGPSTQGMLTCTVCGVKKSHVWYKGQHSWQNPAMCEDCGAYWRRYAIEPNTAVVTDAIVPAKRLAAEDGTGSASPAPRSQKLRTEQTPSARNSPAPMPPKAEPTKCSLCRRLDPRKQLLVCNQCSMSVHDGCYGCSEAASKDVAWLCDSCSNEETLENSLVSARVSSPCCAHFSDRSALQDQRCVLCPLPKMDANGIPEKLNLAPTRGRKPANALAQEDSSNPPITALELMKPTECHNWAHVLCAAYIPEVIYSDLDTFSVVEGAGTLPLWRYHAECEICHERMGACVLCAESGCKRTFHVSCAYAAQPSYHFGFEIKPVKSVRRDTTATVSFKEESGNMKALIWCSEHKESAKNKTLYDLSEIDPASGLTALQAFARTHKHLTALHHTQSALSVADRRLHLLRRAMRYDSIIDGQHGHSTEPSNADISSHVPKARECFNCGSPHSPYWWEVPAKTMELQGGSAMKGPKRFCCNQCRDEVFQNVQEEQ